jgi:hypothetical protein
MQVIPLAAVPSQTLTIALAGVPCQFAVYQKNAYPSFDDTPTPLGQATYPLNQITTESGGPIVVEFAPQQSETIIPRIYVDIYVNDALILAGVPALNAQPMILGAYLGFPGELMFVDMQGADDPVYTGLGARWIFCFLAPIS